MGDFVPGYEVSGTAGIGAPKDTPNEIIAMVNKEINAGLTDPKIRARFAELGTMVLVGSPADFGNVIAGEIEKWAKVIKFANIKRE
jgi:tripartite-type tricarboxylate transporter receptor subunit TctC